MVSTRAKFSSAHARQVVESCPPEKSTRACSRMGRSWNCGLRWGPRQFPCVRAGLQGLKIIFSRPVHRSGANPSTIAGFPSPTALMPDTSETSQPVSATNPGSPRSDAEWRVDRALPRALARILALDDFEEPARRYLPPPMFRYLSVRPDAQTALAVARRTLVARGAGRAGQGPAQWEGRA